MNNKEAYIFHLMNILKEESKCLDKQVVCILTDQDFHILSYGVNTVIACDKNCHDKENRICHTMHAEIMAIDNCHDKWKTYYAFVNLFPCAPCQKALDNYGVMEIVVAGPRHKEQVFANIRLESDLYKDLLLENGEAKQLSVAQGELAELITAVSDFFYRDEKHIKTADIADEIVDVELMLMQIKTICWKKDPEFYNLLRELRAMKHRTLIDKIVKRLL